MKAVIVEIKDKYAAILSDDGCIKKIANQNYVIGQVIELKEEKTRPIGKRFLAVAISVTAVFALFTVSAWAYFTPYYYVSLDVNPSIEYTVNRFDRVIGVEGANEDGEELLSSLQLQNAPIEDAVEDTINQLATENYINGTEQGGIVIATYCDNEQDCEQLTERIQERARECLQEGQIDAELDCEAVGLERVNEAKALGTTPGKLNLVEKLKASSTDPDSITTEDWLDKPVKEIMKAIKDNKDNGKKSDNAQDNNEDALDNNQNDNSTDSNSNGNGNSDKTDKTNNGNSSSNNATQANGSSQTSNGTSTQTKNANATKTKTKTKNAGADDQLENQIQEQVITTMNLESIE